MTDKLRRVTVTAVTGLGLCLTLLPAGAAQAQAPTRVPCNDIAALRAAINEANTAGSSIVLAPRCVYNLSQPDNADDGLPEITGKVRISGKDTYIQRGTGSSQPYRIFHVREGGSLSVESVTVRGGQTTAASGHGGGFFNDRGKLTLKNVTVSNNQGSVGGGIWNQLGTLTLKDSTVRDNRGGFGAGVATNGTMRMSGGGIRDNVGQIWGGGLANAGDTKLDHVSVGGNTSSDNGGGIMTLAINSETGPLRADFTKVRGNIAQTDGGGIQTGADEPTTLYRSTVSHNTANGGPTSGGGIANPGTRFSLFIGTNGAVTQKKNDGNSTKQPTPFDVNLIRSTVFKNHPTNCAPPNSVPGCDAVGSAPTTTKPAKPGRD
ncbi:hypothetical protein DB35_13800 [Streptomyces abyssalis]|uniref:Right handed beta helix domain-containing protein n=1 Tax=Streptomyces abyssalis TaxID=933944 RepID=A0A1E7JGI6_9ACTN|nr:hypothetical protein [Streptomyces abyssalis]OEU85588.1 hypothetical protein AN215_24195 [Streptomyces abyssalis]OEU92947.1 hypothetical protein DB35_13800 [Streptomyces abyssalis]